MFSRHAILSFTAAVFLVAGISQALAGPRAFLRTNVIVDADSIRLDDVFDGAGEYGDRVIAYAPAPGRRLVLEAAWLYKVARAYKVAWRPSSRLDRAVVERRSRVISTRQITDAVLAAIRSEDPRAGDLEVVLDNQALRYFLPHEMPPTLQARAVSYDRRSGRFAVQIVAPDDRPGALRTTVAGQVHTLFRLPVLSRRLDRNEIISKRDIAWKPVRAINIDDETVRDAENLIGLSPRRPMAADRLIRASDLQAPTLVSRGKRVTILLRTAAMQLSAKGTALQNGAKGDLVRVKNTNSGKIVEAVVTGDNEVAVSSNNNLALR